jgi:hypothetical protein
MHRSILQLITGTALVAGMALSARPAWALPTGQTVTSLAEITSPGSGAILAGGVPIIGSALDPDFRQYELEFAPDPPVGNVWQAIQPPVAQQVRDGVLGAWDTAFVEDGRYLLRLRVIRNDGSEMIDQVRVSVMNATPTPTVTPSPTHTPAPTAAAGGTETGPTATPLIRQPPTRTPRAASAPGGATPTPRTIDLTGGGPFQSDRLWQAARRGALAALGAFGLLALYGIAKAVRRGQLRAAWWRFRREIVNPIFDGISRRRRKR